MGKLDISEAERERRREMAKQLHAKKDPVTGRSMFGGPQPGSGRPRKKRATERINERVEQHADEIFDRMLRALRSNKDFVALQAAKQMIEVTNRETDIQLREERTLEDTPTDELVELVTSRLVRLAEGGHLPYDADVEGDEIPLDAIGVGGDDEAEGVEDDQEGPPPHSEGSSGLGTSPFSRRTTG